jgi:hypothetical protein
MKDRHHFNIVLDTRDDGTKVWSAKCLRCDAVIVGESAHSIPIVKILVPIPPSQMEQVRRQVRDAWEMARKTGNPVVLPDNTVEVESLPDHGLQRALDAHIDSCMPKLSKDYK